MRIRYTLAFLLILTQIEIHAQGFWEIYAGVNHSNIIHSIDGQQILYAHTLNSPLWNYGTQVGFNRAIIVSNRVFLDIGLRFQLKGDRKSFHEIAPQNEFHSLRFVDLMTPININFKALNSKFIYFKVGISGNYLIYQNKDNYLAIFPLQTFNEKLGLSSQIGCKFYVSTVFSAELMYSQGLTNIFKLEIPNGTFYPPGSFFTYKHQAFELSIFYKL